MAFVIRPATVDDASEILRMVEELADYEKIKREDRQLTIEKIIKHGFGATPFFKTLVAENQNQLNGYALYYFTYAATRGAPVLYLQDLYVSPESRKQGLGRQFFAELAKIASGMDCCRMEWHVYDWNESAILFYQSIGGELKKDIVQVRLAKDAMNELEFS